MAQSPLFTKPDRDVRLDEASGEDSSPPVVNVEDLLERCMGNLDFVDRVLQAFQESFPDELTDLEKALELEDLERLGLIAHRIRGSSGNVAAEGLQQTAAEIEELCHAGYADEIPAQIDRLRQEWTRYLARPSFALSTAGSP